MKVPPAMVTVALLTACSQPQLPPPPPPPPPVPAPLPPNPPATPASADRIYQVNSDPPPDDGALASHDGSAVAGQQPELSHPFDGLSDTQLAQRLDDALESLGSLSLGSPNAGRLINGMQLPESPLWLRVDPEHAWGTSETLRFLVTAIEHVHEQFDATPPLHVGHISAREGGHLRPHLSHQSGRDVDISFYYMDSTARWYTRANATNLDLPRNWAFVRALVTLTEIELILAHRGILARLEEYARSQGEDADWVEGLFHDRGSQRAILRHARGHRTHFHLRFFNPIAQESARRTHALLAERGLVEPPMVYTSHRCKRGDNLGKLARRYGTTIAALKRANGLRSSKIIAGRTYRIPKPGVRRSPVSIPQRRLPPVDALSP